MDESNKNVLIKSLNVISNFTENVHLVNSPNEFLEIHNRNLKMLSELSLERKSDFIQNLINKYPTLSITELELYISNQKKEKSLLSVAAGGIIDSIFNLVKNKGVSLTQIKSKLDEIKFINNKMTKIVEDPIFEELYKNNA
jgi:hypothetical protein|tara:strand:+ start:72 stop:494 length:423 start_codon:yes stop_codon:yes gene_type:complete